MTFRPSDDVLDGMENWQQPLDASGQYNQISNESVGDSSTWSRIFSNPDEEVNAWDVVENSNVVLTQSVEEVKAPDLSELLENSENTVNWGESKSENQVSEEGNEDFTVDLSEIENDKWWEASAENDDPNQQENPIVESNWWDKQEEDVIMPGKMSDSEREEIISGIEWSVHSKLDLLVDTEWKSVVELYKKIYRILFRWWLFIFVVILGVLWWVMVQVKANQSNIKLVGDSSIGDMSKWVESNTDKILSSQIGNDVEPIISFGSISFNNKSFQSKSNLIKYKWIVLPQLISLDFNSTGFISLDKFANQETTREDLENMIYLITGSIYGKASTLPNIQNSRWEWKTLQWWLMEWFGLECVKNEKLWDFVCDKLLERFYKYGQYYDLSLYSSDLLILVRELSRQNKDIQPICTMIPEYIWHSWVISSDILGSVMSFCSEEDFQYYKKMVNFIDIDNSLNQPELLDKVFEDPDLNAYKLLSAQQAVYRSLKSSSINLGFIKSYLTFVQNLLSKDNKSGRYLAPIYKDLLYVFNTDVLYKTLIEESKFSTELNNKLEQINNGDFVLGYPSLISQLTTSNIVKSEQFVSGNWTWSSLDSIFEKYYGMNDHLQIKKATKLSDTDMQVQTEIYSEDIAKITWWQTLKATILLHKKQNVLYVKTINVWNQRNLSETLNIYAADWNVSFDKMLWYIDEQIAFWYKAPWEDSEPEFVVCDELKNMNDIYMNTIEIYECDESSVVLYRWDVEYAFTLLNWILESFVISDSNIELAVKEKLGSVMTSRENTPTIIESIVSFEMDKPDEINIEKKLEIIDQFRIHLKLVPTISDIDGEDSVFMVEFSVGSFNLQAHYDIDTHLLSKISYVACGKTLEIRNLTIEVSANNSSQLTELLNNPRMFFASANSAAYRKYQRMCE